MLTVILLLIAWTALGWFAWLCVLPPFDAEAELEAQLERDWEDRRMAGDPPDNIVELRRSTR